MLGLYIHIPFCLSKCPYCDFYSIIYDKNTAESYRNAVIRNLKAYDEEYDTVYFGGGTPILLWREIGEILRNTRTVGSCEITIEANPCCTTEEALCSLLEAGVNRISFGVQSLNKDELSQLGRRHSAEQAEKAVLLADKCGFKNISADIMLGTPTQTAESTEETVARLALLPLTHVSAYLLKIEPNTPFEARRLDLPDEDSTCDIYLQTAELLQKNSFSQYEISNFAKKGFECRHNLKYWSCGDYLGIGPAAHSLYKGKRFFVERSCDEFISLPFQKTVIEDETPCSFDEYAMLRLRLCEGLSFDECLGFGVEKNVLENRIKALPKHLYNIDDRHIRLTREGFLISNNIIGAILGY